MFLWPPTIVASTTDQTIGRNKLSALVDQTRVSVLVILGRKCMLAAPRAAPNESRYLCAARIKLKLEKDGTDRRTDGRTPDRCIKLIARRGQRTNRCFVLAKSVLRLLIITRKLSQTDLESAAAARRNSRYILKGLRLVELIATVSCAGVDFLAHPVYATFTHRRRHRQPIQMMVTQMTKAATAIITMTTNAKMHT